MRARSGPGGRQWDRETIKGVDEEKKKERLEKRCVLEIAN